VGKLSILELDTKGRLTLPKDMRESLNIGKKILIINAGDHIKIIPLPLDPLKVLHGAFNVKKPFKELRQQAVLTAENEAKEERGRLSGCLC
jgi:bifunctional DNA-binding transcriptional regulator/antitoxin component of YhaV-PrlF toxin-antitoxin module